MTEVKHFGLKSGLSPSQLLDRIENGLLVEPSEPTTSLSYAGPEQASTVEDTPTIVVANESSPPPPSVTEVGTKDAPPSPPLVSIPVPRIAPSSASSITPEQACETIYQCLPFPCQRSMDDMLVNLKLTKPQFILGILNASYAQGNFSAPLLDPAWATPGTNFLIGDLICNGCGKEFTPKYRGQLYCSNVCALKVLSTEEKANVAKAHETRRQNTLASEQGFQTGE